MVHWLTPSIPATGHVGALDTEALSLSGKQGSVVFLVRCVISEYVFVNAFCFVVVTVIKAGQIEHSESVSLCVPKKRPLLVIPHITDV